MTNSPLRHADLWHTGIVVDELASACDDLGVRLGVRWHTGGAEVRLITADAARTVTTGYALSTEGPHHIELTQAIDGTLWTASGPGETHHVGYWVDDVVAAADALESGGAQRLATVAVADDAPPMCTYHRMTSGLVVEVVTRHLKRVLLPEAGS